VKYLGSFDATQVIPKNGIASGNYINVGSADSGQKILLSNMSNNNLVLQFGDGSSDILHAGQANYWVLENICPQIEWSIASTLNLLNIPCVLCTAVLYNAHEPITGVYPCDVAYFTSIGNPLGVSTNVTSTSSALVNDGNTAGTVFIESTVTGQSNSSLTVTNDGMLTLKTVIGGVLAQQIKTQATGNGLLLGNAGTGTEVVGSLIVDQNATITGWISGTMKSNLYEDGLGNSILAITAGATTRLQAPTTVAIQVPVGSSIATFNSTGASITGSIIVSGSHSTDGGAISSNGSGALTVGSLITNVLNDTGGNGVLSITAGTTTRVQSPGTVAIQIPAGTNVMTMNATGVNVIQPITTNGAFLGAMSVGSTDVIHGFKHGSVSGTSGTVTHGLGATPFWVGLIVDSGSATDAVATGNYTSTTFDWKCSVSATHRWFAIG
jgi:hypothetical protein